MTEPINFDVDYKTLIKEKLINTYEANPSLIRKIDSLRRKNQAFRSKNTGECFSPNFLIGFILGLCPELADLILLSLELNSDPSFVLTTLGLNFDPESELKERNEERQKTLNQSSHIDNLLAEDLEYREVQEGLEEIRSQIKQLENSSL